MLYCPKLSFLNLLKLFFSSAQSMSVTSSIRFFLLNCILLLIPLTSFSQNPGYATLEFFKNKDSYLNSDTVKVAIKISIKEKFHINSFKVDDPDLIATSIVSESENFKLVNTYFPQDKKLKFEFSENEINVYEDEIIAGVSFLPLSNLQNGKYDLSISFTYQACDDKTCFPPKTINEKLDILISSESGKLTNSDIFGKIDFSKPSINASNEKSQERKLTENTRSDKPASEEDQVSNWIEEKGMFVSLILIFLGGLALNLTPCVYPLIPITVSFFGAQSSGSKSQSILMGIFYALGMSVTYSFLGVFAALTGSLLGTALQNPVVIIVIALILFALGTSMFGLFEIKVPQSLALMGNKNRSGYFGSVLMGLTVGFIAAPCIGPFVLSLLVYVGKIGNAFTGFLLFFVLSLGLGFPYIFLAASSSSISKLPRSGEWMEGVKIIFGLILFGMALNTLAPLFPDNVFNIIFPLYIILSGAYLILIDKKGYSSPVFSKIKYIIAIVAVIFGTWNLKPKEAESEVKWSVLNSLEAVDNSIKTGNKPVMIDFYADWCAQCKELDEYTYTDPEIVELSGRLNNIKIDLTKENSAITEKFDIKGLPVVIFMNQSGEEYKDLRVTGFLKPEDFKEKINSLQKYTSDK
ncbi:MAG: Thiol:disulfide interchange protein DsbD [Ignavibacteria bacterium]|nr:Thiol:disulfide interchange protein DsbD [Ignavibacteria bacterium]